MHGEALDARRLHGCQEVGRLGAHAMTPVQLRAARLMLGLTQDELNHLQSVLERLIDATTSTTGRPLVPDDARV